MSIELRRAYLAEIRDRYQKAPKRQKFLILNEFCAVCRYSRKYAIRILNGRVEPRMKKTGPKSPYRENSEFIEVLKYIWEATGRACSKKLKAALPIWLPKYKEKRISILTKTQLLAVSPASIDRFLKPFKSECIKGLSTTKRPHIKSKIPIELLDKHAAEPGHVEADTVSHCGDSAEGKFVSTLTVVDLCSAWTENRATWTKHAEKIVEALSDIEKSLPFLMISFASDNGSEFLNETLYNYLKDPKKGRVQMKRRRPYKKNDAAHVEQKNDTHVRQLFGYDRLDDERFVPIMNEIYRAYWNPLHNFFIPSLKLKEKIRVGARIKKIYEKPKTPYERLLESESISQAMKRRLKMLHEGYNPFTLKKLLDEKMRLYYRLVETSNKRQKVEESIDDAA